MLLTTLIFPPKLFPQSLSFPENEPEIFHQATDTAYDRQNGSSESSETAPVFHVPITSRTNQSYLTIDNLSASLLTGNEAQSRISIPVEISVSDTGKTWDAFIAAQKSGSEQYQIIYNRPNVTDGQEIDLTPDLKDLCAADNDLAIDCSKFQSGGDDREEIVLLMGIGIQGEVDHAPVTDSIEPADYEDGHYVKIKLSSLITARAPDLNGLYKGENRLQVHFQGMDIQDGDSLYAYVNDRNASNGDENCEKQGKATSSTYSALTGGGKHQKLDTIATAGKATVKGLKNGQCYSIQIYYRDRYGFATHVSGGLNASPELLAKLLEKNSCFLLTAGFGGDHPVIEDFRHFRDHTLRRYALGRAFIRLYYRYAPTLAPLIPNSPLLAALIRSAARTFHALFLKTGPVPTV